MLVDAHILQQKEVLTFEPETRLSNRLMKRRSPSTEVSIKLCFSDSDTRPALRAPVPLTGSLAVGRDVLGIQRLCHNPFCSIYAHYKGPICKIDDV